MTSQIAIREGSAPPEVMSQSIVMAPECKTFSDHFYSPILYAKLEIIKPILCYYHINKEKIIDPPFSPIVEHKEKTHITELQEYILQSVANYRVKDENPPATMREILLLVRLNTQESGIQFRDKSFYVAAKGLVKMGLLKVGKTTRQTYKATDKGRKLLKELGK